MSSSSRGAQVPRVARAATRYRPGQAPVQAGETYSDDDDDDEDERDQRQAGPSRVKVEDEAAATADISRGTRNLANGQRRTAGIVLQTGDGPMQSFMKPGSTPQMKMGAGISAPTGHAAKVEDDSSEYETDTDEDEPGPSRPVFRKPGQVKSETAAASMPVQDQSSEYETDSEDEEEEEEMPKPIFKPLFKPKAARKDGALNAENAKEVAIEDAEAEAERKARELAEERRKQSHQLAAHTIKREIAEREADDAKPDLDDTDGTDPDAEFAAWQARELARLEREKQALAEKEAEEQEQERRRNMTEAQRLAEDTARAEASRNEKQKGEMGFMEKYYHKGSFFQDLDILKKRDYTQATESAVDKRLLPKIMQVRDYGKASRSKWTHLANEDTSRKQEDPRFKGMSGSGMKGADGAAGQGCFNCGGPHLRRDCSEPRQQPSGSGSADFAAGPGRGANNFPLRPRDTSRRYDSDDRGDKRRRYDERDDRDRDWRYRSQYTDR